MSRCLVHCPLCKDEMPDSYLLCSPCQKRWEYVKAYMHNHTTTIAIGDWDFTVQYVALLEQELHEQLGVEVENDD